MIGFTKLGEAIHTALNIEDLSFTELYLQNRDESLARSLDSSPAALAIKEMMQSRGGEAWTWEGTVKSLKQHEFLTRVFYLVSEIFPLFLRNVPCADSIFNFCSSFLRNLQSSNPGTAIPDPAGQLHGSHTIY